MYLYPFGCCQDDRMWHCAGLHSMSEISSIFVLDLHPLSFSKEKIPKPLRKDSHCPFSPRYLFHPKGAIYISAKLSKLKCLFLMSSSLMQAIE